MSTTESDRRVGRDEGAGVEQALADEAVHRRPDLGAAERDLQLVEAGLRLVELGAREIELGLRRLMAGVGVVERLARQELALEQAARAIEVGLGELQVGLALAHGRACHVERRLGLVHLFLDLAGLDPGEGAALDDAIADPDRDLLEAAVDLAGDFDRRLALEVADDGDEVGHRGARTAEPSSTVRVGPGERGAARRRRRRSRRSGPGRSQ